MFHGNGFKRSLRVPLVFCRAEASLLVFRPDMIYSDKIKVRLFHYMKTRVVF